MSFPMNNMAQADNIANAPPIEEQPSRSFPPSIDAHLLPKGEYPPRQGGNVPFPPGYQPVWTQPHGAEEEPIVNQPGSPQSGWMAAPAGIPNCPPGLEYIAIVDELVVMQKIEFPENLFGIEKAAKYIIKNNLGQKLYLTKEESNCCGRECCSQLRAAEIKIINGYKNEVISLNRPCRCDSNCFACCLQKMEVSAPPGNVIGSIEQEVTFLFPKYRIKNHSGETVLRLVGICCNCDAVEFEIVTMSGDEIGKISKRWSGFMPEVHDRTDLDLLGITFPIDLDVHLKATLLGALFLVDMLFFEAGRTNQMLKRRLGIR